VNYKTSGINTARVLLIIAKDLLLFGNAILNRSLVLGELNDQMIPPQIAMNKHINQALGWV